MTENLPTLFTLIYLVPKIHHLYQFYIPSPDLFISPNTQLLLPLAKAP